MWWLIRTIFVGFIVGVIAKFVTPGTNKYEPKGFLLTTALGIAGALAALSSGSRSAITGRKMLLVGSPASWVRWVYC